MKKLVSVSLTPAEATLFKKFRQYQDSFGVLIGTGLFTLRSGQVVVDKHNGVIQGVRIQTTSYKRKRKT